MPRRTLIALVILLPALSLAACSTTSKSSASTRRAPDYGRPLPPGSSALRLVTDPARMPDLALAFGERDDRTLAAMDESLTWFAAPSSRGFFPFEGITHERARQSVAAMRELLASASDANAFRTRVQERFQVFESVGYDGSGVVLFTGYFSPIFPASLRRTSRFTHPLYKRPDDLVTDDRTGEPRGRRTARGQLASYPTRREIEGSGMLDGTELVWLEDALSSYLVHVNGSAKLRLEGGKTMFVGYAGKTDHGYSSLSKAMVSAGLLDGDAVTLSGIRRAYRDRPQEVEDLMLENDSYVFFTEYAGDTWPAGSLGVKVTAEASLATDKRIYPRGGVVLADTKSPTVTAGPKRFTRFMCDQDTGGAIRAPGRADLFMGIGPRAEVIAGGQYAEGKLYYFFLKPEHVDERGRDFAAAGGRRP